MVGGGKRNSLLRRGTFSEPTLPGTLIVAYGVSAKAAQHSGHSPGHHLKRRMRVLYDLVRNGNALRSGQKEDRERPIDGLTPLWKSLPHESLEVTLDRERN